MIKVVPIDVIKNTAAATVHFGKDVPAHEIDMGEGAFLLSAAYAQQLLAPPVPPAPPEVEAVPIAPTTTSETPPDQLPQISASMEEATRKVVNELPTTMMPVPPSAQPAAPGKGGQRYRLSMKIKPGDFFEVMKALEKLNDRSEKMETTVTLIATAKPGQSFVANTMHNLVVEPMVEESEVVVIEERVEE